MLLANFCMKAFLFPFATDCIKCRMTPQHLVYPTPEVHKTNLNLVAAIFACPNILEAEL
jgi:hypothetical protein